MTYLTPLELRLENYLARIGLPFIDRLLIHEETQEAYAQIQNMSDKEIEEIAVLDIRARMRARKKAPMNWDRHLVYRVTEISTAGFDVKYSVFPSEENVERFRKITDPKQYLPTLDRIIRYRTFFSEEVALRYNPLHEDMTPELLEQVREDTYEDLSDNRNSRDVSIDFCEGKVKIFTGSEMPNDFFKGIRSPTRDAYELARRIAEYFRSLS
ncbi:hypothetical protein J4447_00875 [Candidatus Pacearchaeota archaeon]|nr:hypothetical protein [Candidatus Pacearchaeota archaeon]